jgi:SAM-dependent methyltransferase
MKSYYSDKLSAENLKRCYDIAPPRVQQYLSAEIEYVRSKIKEGDLVLEMGCGCGRALAALIGCRSRLYGIDISLPSLRMAQAYLDKTDTVFFSLMDALHMGFGNACFDAVFCIQNGISAFHVDQRALIEAAVSVTNPGGHILFSSYAEEFWHDRLEWFRMQATQGLIGEIDEEETGNGVIVCKDGFRATTVTAAEFSRLAEGTGRKVVIETVDGSSIFCDITV